MVVQRLQIDQVYFLIRQDLLMIHNKLNVNEYNLDCLRKQTLQPIHYMNNRVRITV